MPTTCVCDTLKIPPVLDLIAGILISLSGVINMIFLAWGWFQIFILWLFGIFFGVVLILLGVTYPQWILTWMPFMQTFLGKGAIILFGGCLVGTGWSDRTQFQFLTFVYCVAIWITYIILHFVCTAMPAPLAPGCGCQCAGGGASAGGVAMRQTTTTTTTTRTARRAPGGKLPRGWTSEVDPSSGQVFYVHSATNRTQWERPRQ